MKIVIRDDDTCAFTRPEDIESCYASIWDNAPVSLSVTPFRIPGNDKNLPKHLFGKMEIMPLHENGDLIQMLRSGITAGRIDISMHGYHHLCYHGKPEYVAGTDLYEKTKNGHSYLEKHLNTKVLSFVPPNNGISKDGLRAVIAAGMNLVNVPSLYSAKRRPLSAKTLRYIPVYYWHRKIHGMKYPYVLNMQDHCEVEYHTVGPQSRQSLLFAELDYCHENNGIFVLSTHYHAFEKKTLDGDSVRSVVYRLIDRAAAMPDTDFVGINDIW